MEKVNTSTGVRKRQQILSANKAVFVWITIASIVLGVSGVIAQFMIRQLVLNQQILSALNTTDSNLQKSITAYDGLKQEVVKLVADGNLNSLKKGANSTALQVIIDALPTEENRVALATSMQKEILGPSGVTIESFSIVDQATGVPSASTTGDAQSFDFSFTISGSAAQIQQAFRNIERSIRPIAIQLVDMQGTDSKMKANVTASTYYQAAKMVEVKERKL